MTTDYANIGPDSAREGANGRKRRSVNNVPDPLHQPQRMSDDGPSLIATTPTGVNIDFQDISVSAKKAAVLLQKSALASSTSLVERDTLMLVIEENQQRFWGCLMLPLTLLFFIFYASAARVHEDITQAHLMESPFRSTFNPDLDEDEGEEATTDMLQGIVTVDDVWHFLEKVYVPTMFSDKDEYGNLFLPQERGREFLYNNLVGAVVLEQQRSVAGMCKEAEAAHMMCYDQLTKSNIDFGRNWSDMPNVGNKTAYDFYRMGKPTPIIECDLEGFRAFKTQSGACANDTAAPSRRMEILRDELWAKMPPKSDDPKGLETFKFYLFRQDSNALILQRLAYLKSRGFIDHQTTEVSVKAMYLNNELDIPRLESVRITFYISRGGGIYVTLRMNAIFLKSFPRAMAYVMDFCFACMLLASTITMSISFVWAIRKRRLWGHFTTVNVITWLTIIMGWWWGLGLYSMIALRHNVKTKLEDVWVRNDPETAFALNASADEFLDFALWYRVFLADAHIIFMMRCFVALQWQPRLAVVTHTLVDTSVDLFHFLLVFIPTFIAFAIAGHAMFGRRMQQFSTIEGAICVCFKLSMESEFDWWAYSEEDFFTALSWVWLYILLVVLLMLNMVLAIIMDVYSVIRLQAGNSETVWENIYFLGMRAWYHRKWLKDHVIIEKVSGLPRIVSEEELREAFLNEDGSPGMIEYQHERLVKCCNGKAQAVMRMGVHDSYSAEMTAATKIGLDGISHDIANLKNRGWMGRGVEAGSLPERMMAQDCLQSCAMQGHWMNLMQGQLDVLRKKTHGLSDMVNLLVTFYGATGLPASVKCYASCFITGRPDLNVCTRTTAYYSQTPKWDEELELVGFNSKRPKPLQFNVYDEDTDPPQPMVAAKLPVNDFFPDGYAGSLKFPGGLIHVKVEVTNPLAETTV